MKKTDQISSKFHTIIFQEDDITKVEGEPQTWKIFANM